MKETIQKLNFDDDFLIESAEKRYDEGDYLGALTVLNKRETLHEPLADAYAVYADVYEAMGLYGEAVDAWYRFLDTCNEEDFAEGYEGLAVAFLNMGNEFQAAFYYHRAYEEDMEEPEVEEFVEPEEPPKLRLVHGEGSGEGAREAIAEGLALLRGGNLAGARLAFSQVEDDNEEYPSAAGLSAMCTLMLGDEAGAAEECRRVLEKYPNNVQALTTYCAVLGAREDREGAREAAKKLASLPCEETDDLYRAATALCETGLDEEAFAKLRVLRERLPYDENVLWFSAVAAVHTERTEAAIDALEMLVTVYPRKAVAKWYLERLREMRDGGERVTMNYYYHMPEAKYRAIAENFLRICNLDEEAAEALSSSQELAEDFRLAFDEMEGRDEKLQVIAGRVAARCRADALLREVLIDWEEDESVKLSILHELVARNEDNSFGTVVCNLYKEFYIHELDIDKRKQAAFMQAFADVYAKFALLAEEHEGKICAAAEDVYHSLAEVGAWEYFDERASLAAAIYRESRLKDGVRKFSDIVEMFGANELVAKHILDIMM